MFQSRQGTTHRVKIWMRSVSKISFWLIINGNMLEKVSPEKGGITVGTKTKYVKGRYMRKAAVGKFRRVVRIELDRRIRENFK